MITLPESITIKEFAEKMKVQPAAIVKKLFLEGKIVTVNQEISPGASPPKLLGLLSLNPAPCPGPPLPSRGLPLKPRLPPGPAPGPRRSDPDPAFPERQAPDRQAPDRAWPRRQTAGTRPGWQASGRLCSTASRSGVWSLRFSVCSGRGLGWGGFGGTICTEGVGDGGVSGLIGRGEAPKKKETAKEEMVKKETAEMVKEETAKSPEKEKAKPVKAADAQANGAPKKKKTIIVVNNPQNSRMQLRGHHLYGGRRRRRRQRLNRAHRCLGLGPAVVSAAALAPPLAALTVLRQLKERQTADGGGNGGKHGENKGT